jgi:hypothetical protein
MQQVKREHPVMVPSKMFVGGTIRLTHSGTRFECWVVFFHNDVMMRKLDLER